MKYLIFLISIISFSLISSSCESLQNGPLASSDEQGNMLKPGEPISSAKEVKVAKIVYEDTQVQEIYWTDNDFDLPDFQSQTFTITSVEVCIVSDNETANVSAEMFGKKCSTPVSDCQLAAILCWEGEYPEEHPFYDGFDIHVSSTEVLETVEAVCSITYTIH